MHNQCTILHHTLSKFKKRSKAGYLAKLMPTDHRHER